MAAGIHRSAYTSNRPVTPNTTHLPLGLAPGATVNVYLTGGAVHASLFTDAALTNPLGNPFVSDANAFYEFYTDPANGDVDEAFSGVGIVTPYAVTSVLNLDPRITAAATGVTALTAALVVETANRLAADLVLQEIGVAYPIGGSIQVGQTNAARVDAFDAILFTIDGTDFAGYTMTVTVQTKTDDPGTSVTPILRNVTTAADAGTGVANALQAPTAQSFVATIAAGVNTYKLQLLPSNANAAVYGGGLVQIAVP